MSDHRVRAKKALHVDATEKIKDLIRRNKLSLGDALPSYAEISKRIRVSLVTVQKAMHLLQEEGVIESRPGRGAIVASELSSDLQRISHVALIFGPTKSTVFRTPYLHDLLEGLVCSSDRLEVDTRIISVKSGGPVTPKELDVAGIDGAILCGIQNDAYLRSFVNASFPVVVADTMVADLPLNFVLADNIAATRRIVEYLYELGHRKIAYVDQLTCDPVFGGLLQKDVSVVQSSDNVERYQAFLSVMEEFNLHPAGPVLDVSNAAHWIQSNPASRPTAIVAYDEMTARELMESLKDGEVRCPQDVSVAAVMGPSTAEDDVSMNKLSFIEMGRTAMALLAESKDVSDLSKARVVRIESTFERGNSCG